MYKHTLVVNMYRGPGSGKSTGASEIFGILKRNGVDCELASEFAKDLVWEERKDTFKDQTYIMAKQNHRLFRLNHKVEVIITDSPLLLTAIYKPKGYDFLNDTAFNLYKKYENVNFFIKRVKPYNPNGRNETEEESNLRGEEIRDMLDNYNVPYQEVYGDEQGSQAIAKMIIEKVMTYRSEL